MCVRAIFYLLGIDFVRFRAIILWPNIDVARLSGQYFSGWALISCVFAQHSSGQTFTSCALGNILVAEHGFLVRARNNLVAEHRFCVFSNFQSLFLKVG